MSEEYLQAAFEIKAACDDISRKLLRWHWEEKPNLRTEKLENLELWKKLYQEMLEKKQCVSLKTLAVTGRDLIDTGMKPGRELGEMLQQLLELVLEHPEQNTREQLLEKVKELSADKD